MFVCRNYTLLGPIGGTIFLIFYLISLINTLRMLYLCGRTEPGFIPKIRSKQIDYNKQYRILYKTPDEIMEDVAMKSEKQENFSAVEAFFSTNAFRIVTD